MRTPGSAAELEARRRRAAEHFQAGKSPSEVAESLSVHVSSAKRWQRAWSAGGRRGVGREAAPRRRLQVVRRAEAIARQDAHRRPAGGRIQDRPVDLCTGRRSRAQEVPHPVRSGAFLANPA
ncbi:MAG: helix-turn-helix domain-containing protein [Pirellulales bacterium]|nr:helix-turn-helix domain-containing protein [Pirellulales bacterium]